MAGHTAEHFTVFLRKDLWFLPALLLCYWAVSADAQGNFGVRFRHFTTEDGLPQNTAYCQLQDQHGFLWLGTESGLVRYDGYTFRTFKHQPGDSTSLGNNWVRTLAEDAEGTLWVGTQNGLFRFWPLIERFAQIPIPAFRNGENDLTISEIITVENGQTVIVKAQSGTLGGLFTYHLPTGNSQTLKLPELAESKWAHNPGLLASGEKVLVTAFRSVYVINPKTLEFQQYTLEYRPVEKLGKMIEMSEHQFLLATNNGLVLFGLNEKSFSSFETGFPEIDRATVFGMTWQKPGKQLWVGTTNGLFRLEKQDKKWHLLSFIHQPEVPGSLGNNHVVSLMADREGLLWVGTAASLDRYDPQHEAFRNISRQQLPTLPSEAILSITTDKEGKLWLGTSEGLLGVQFKEGQRVTGALPLGQMVEQTLEIPSLKGNSIRSLFTDESDRIWAGCNRGWLSVLSPEGQLLKVFKLKGENGENGVSQMVNGMLPLSAGKWLLAQELGLSVLDTESGKLTSLRSLVSRDCPGFSFQPFHLLGAERASDGSVWLASFTGLLHYLPTENRFLPVDFPAEKSSPRKIASVYAPPLQDSVIWISTFGEGLFAYFPAQHRLEHWGEAEGLPNEMVYGVLPDEAGSLWMSTNRGIGRLDPKEQKFSVFRTSEGILTNEFNKIAFHQDAAGQFYFGTDKGLVVFDPVLLSDATHPPEVRMTSLEINYRSARERRKELSASGALHLYPEDKVVSFGFAGLAFRNPQGVRYAYRLTGFDDNWIDPPAGQRIATYSSLPAGEYVFEVKTALSSKDWGKDRLQVRVNVHPPFWQTLWFLGGSLLVFAALLAAAVRYWSQLQLKRQIRQMETERQLQQERERIARDLHDHIGSKLAYLSYHLEQVTDDLQQEAPELEQKHRGQFAEMQEFTQETIQQLRETIWAINKKSVSVQELSDRIGQLLWKLPKTPQLPNFRFQEAGEEAAAFWLSPIQALNLFRIAQEAISNVLKHSRATEASVAVHTSAEILFELTVSDNGTGTAISSDNPESYGLKNMQHRAAEIGAHFGLKSEPKKGTEVRVRLGK